MTGPGVAEIEAAGERLRGQLVATPLIGVQLLPGWRVPAGLRIKPEVLQPAGSIHYRGAMHYLLRRLGSPKGVLAHGGEQVVLAAAFAAAQHRLAAIVFPVGEPDAALWALLRALGCEARPRPTAQEAHAAAEAARAGTGFHLLPGLAHPDYTAGIATAGLELADELPAETARVLVPHGDVAQALALGLAARGASIQVQGIDPAASAFPAGLADAVRTALHLDLRPDSLATLHWALQHEPGPALCLIL